jgi:hypothetical protein
MAENGTTGERGENGPSAEASSFTLPQISLPEGGGAIPGIDEKFAANPVAGTGSLSIPTAASPGRSGFGPQLSLTVDSGSGNGIFGMGFRLAALDRPPHRQRVSAYRDAEEAAIFILSGAEDLVPVLERTDTGQWIFDEFDRDGYRVKATARASKDCSPGSSAGQNSTRATPIGARYLLAGCQTRASRTRTIQVAYSRLIARSPQEASAVTSAARFTRNRAQVVHG